MINRKPTFNSTFKESEYFGYVTEWYYLIHTNTSNDLSRHIKELIVEQARHLRKNPTEAEAVLWRQLRKRQQVGFKFRRQHIISTYIVDFYCPSAKLVVEIDGPVHHKQAEYDRERENDLHAMGYEIVRFTNDEVLSDLPVLLDKISQKLSQINSKKTHQE